MVTKEVQAGTFCNPWKAGEGEDLYGLRLLVWLTQQRLPSHTQKYHYHLVPLEPAGKQIQGVVDSIMRVR